MPQATPPEPASPKKILISVVAALAVALVVLVVVIWPAEYGRDPTGIGNLLGITRMSTPTNVIEVTTLDPISGNESIREVEIPAFGDPVPLPNPNIHQEEASAPRTETIELEIPADGRTEIKTVLRENKMIAYEWSVDQGAIYSEFHGHNPEFGDEFWVMYKKHQSASGGSGSLVAPFDGEHGWYWQNYNDHPVNVTLTVTGFFDDTRDYGIF